MVNIRYFRNLFLVVGNCYIIAKGDVFVQVLSNVALFL